MHRSSVRPIAEETQEPVEHLVGRCVELGLPAHRQPVEGSADNLLVGWSERPELLHMAYLLRATASSG